MNTRLSNGFLLISAVVCILAANAAAKFRTRQDRSAQQARAEIERLHQQDVAATFSGKADDLAKLWDQDAVRISPGSPAEIGKAAIYAGDKRDEANGFVGHTVCYNPEIKDLEIAGDWAFEWGYFSYRGRGDKEAGRGKVLRVIKRQPDGSWKFARVIDFPEELPSAAPMSHPCE